MPELRRRVYADPMSDEVFKMYDVQAKFLFEPWRYDMVEFFLVIFTNNEKVIKLLRDIAIINEDDKFFERWYDLMRLISLSYIDEKSDYEFFSAWFEGLMNNLASLISRFENAWMLIRDDEFETDLSDLRSRYEEIVKKERSKENISPDYFYDLSCLMEDIYWYDIAVAYQNMPIN